MKNESEEPPIQAVYRQPEAEAARRDHKNN